MVIHDGLRLKKNGRSLPAWVVPMLEDPGADAIDVAADCKEIAGFARAGNKTWRGWTICNHEETR